MSNKKRISRRNFLQIIAVGTVAGATAQFSAGVLTQTKSAGATRLLMGTVTNLTVISDDKAAAQTIIDATFNRMTALEEVLSRFKSESLLSQLNRSGQLDNAHPALLALIVQSRRLSERSGGAFDITVKPLVDLYQRHQAANSFPSQTEIAAVLEKVDYRKIRIDGKQVIFEQPGMSITLDGIAKGFIVDEGVKVLNDAGFENVLVEAGGDLLASGQKSAGEAWQIGVQSPRKSQPDILARLTIRNQAVATSGDYMQAFTHDLSHHHILDPRTGYSAPESASATVIAPSTMLADGLATTAMVLGPQMGISLINELPNCEACLVDKNLQQFTTANYQALSGKEMFSG
ncbi:MAG: FAD:protein FMN transferase [Caldilineaceae bacterium]|nr:FAD:protein FMN transferase [Caldilineaceae bacterium]